jgi:hypothetical protein
LLFIHPPGPALSHGVLRYLLEMWLHLRHPLSDCLNKIIVPRDLTGDDRELVPLVPLQNAQHGSSLVFQRWRQLQLKTELRSSLKNTKKWLSYCRLSQHKSFEINGN